MRERDQVILHAVHEEGGDPNILDSHQVVKAILDQEFNYTASLVFHDPADGLEGGHENDGGRLAHAGQVSRRPRAHAATEDKHIALVDAQHHVQIIVDVCAVVEDILLARIEHALIVRLVRVESVAVAGGLDLGFEGRSAHRAASDAALVRAQVKEHGVAANTILISGEGGVHLLVLALERVGERPRVLVAPLVLARVQAVAGVLDGDDVHTQHGAQAVEQLVAEHNVLGVCVEVDQQL